MTGCPWLPAADDAEHRCPTCNRELLNATTACHICAERVLFERFGPTDYGGRPRAEA